MTLPVEQYILKTRAKIRARKHLAKRIGRAISMLTYTESASYVIQRVTAKNFKGEIFLAIACTTVLHHTAKISYQQQRMNRKCQFKVF